MHQTATNRVMIFDTTPRDGEQAPGCSMTLREKLRVATALRDLRVDVIEAGFPAASPGDFESVQAIATEIQGPIIGGLARCHAGDIERVWRAVQPAARPRIHVFIATSEIHRTYKLQMTKEEVIRRAVESPARGKAGQPPTSARRSAPKRRRYCAGVRLTRRRKSRLKKLASS